MKQQYLCPVDNEVVERTDMVKGYEYAKDQYVHFTEEELEEARGRQDRRARDRRVRAGVDGRPRLHREDLLPRPRQGRRQGLPAPRAGDEARRRRSRSVAYWTRGREQLVLIRPYNDGLILHYVYYANEVRAFDEVGVGSVTRRSRTSSSSSPTSSSSSSRAAEFNPDQYHDEYEDRVQHGRRTEGRRQGDHRRRRSTEGADHRPLRGAQAQPRDRRAPARFGQAREEGRAAREEIEEGCRGLREGSRLQAPGSCAGVCEPDA